jgi:lipoprotein-anchoring transpeptidase ErfK/SrfK
MSKYLILFLLLTSSTAFAKEFKQDTKEYVDEDGITYTRYLIRKDDFKAAKEADKNVIIYLFGEEASTNIWRYNRFELRYSWVGRLVRVPKIDPKALYSPCPQTVENLKKYPQYIVVDLEKQFLCAYENGKLFKSHPVSTGNPKSKEPGGWFKDRSTKPSLRKILAKDSDHVSDLYPEASKENHYRAGGASMYYALIIGDGMALHIGNVIHNGTETRNKKFVVRDGKISTDSPKFSGGDSHQCIRQLDMDAIIMYFWAEVGTPVRIVKNDKKGY